MPRHPGDLRRTLHLLNRRYHHEWLRAEALEAALARARWFGPLFSLARTVKRLLRPTRPESFQPAAEAVPFDEPRLAPPGLVSVIIPFKDQPGLLRACLRSLRASTRPYEVVLVDNGSAEDRTRRLLAKTRHRVVRAPEPFHFSRLCNQGAAVASGEFLLFLNNDTEALADDWAERLLRPLSDPEIGVVGGTLYFPDGTIQHAGLQPRADGRWVHAHSGEAGVPDGDRPRLVPAVTAACLVLRRDLFRQLGGFADHLPLTYNDVDLCRRAAGLGLKTCVTPHARFLHYECLPRGHAKDAPGANHLDALPAFPREES